MYSMLLAVASIFAAQVVFAQSTADDDEFPGKITCYNWSGQPFTNNTQCPGSRICCQTADLCSPDRFCLANDQIIVPTCSTFPWDDCANICQYDPGTGFLPRAVNCTDGSFCCDDDPTCCAENRGIVLNGLGAVVSTNSGTSTTSTSTSIAQSTSSAETTTSSTRPATTTASPTAAADQPGSSETTSNPLSNGAKAGIAIGAVAIFVSIVALVWLVIRYKRRLQAQSNSHGQNNVAWSYRDGNSLSHEMPNEVETPYQEHYAPNKAEHSYSPVETRYELEHKNTTYPTVHEMPN